MAHINYIKVSKDWECALAYLKRRRWAELMRQRDQSHARW